MAGIARGYGWESLSPPSTRKNGRKNRERKIDFPPPPTQHNVHQLARSRQGLFSSPQLSIFIGSEEVCVFSGGGIWIWIWFGCTKMPTKRGESKLHFHPWLRGNQRPHRRATSRGKKADPRGHKSISSHDGTGILIFTNFPSRKLQKIVEETPTKLRLRLPVIDWLIDRSTNCSIDWLIDWLLDWLIGWLIGWLIDWLID